MIPKDNNTRTDQAWERLHNRLESDGLLNETTSSLKPFFPVTALKWAASLVILASATLILLFYPGSSDKQMLSLYNADKSHSLVKILEDGSVVYLSGNSTLYYPNHFQKHKREVSIKGDGFFQISKNKKAPFTVHTDKMDVEVLGTSFIVRSGDSGNAKLSVNTGIVRVAMNGKNQSARLVAGEEAVINAGNLQTMQIEDHEQFARFLERIHFKDESLENVVSVINRIIPDTKLEITKGLEGRMITASFEGNSADSMAQLICIALNLKYDYERDKIRIHE